MNHVGSGEGKLLGKTISGITVSLLIMSMLTLAFNIQPATASLPVHNIDTGLSYATIQEAINANETLHGHTIMVDAGVYYENVVLNKTLSLVGENRDFTVIDANGTGNGIVIQADYGMVENFTIQNSDLDLGCSGIVLSRSRDSTITGNIITTNGIGIYVVFSGNVTLNYNLVTNNSVGIQISFSHQNTVNGNIITSGYKGIFIQSSGNNVLRNNNIVSNTYNFGIIDDDLSHLVNDIDTSNTVNGKAIHYLINKQHLTIDPSTFPNVGYLAVINSTYITVRHLNFSNNFQGILFAHGANSEVENVNVSDNFHGIMLYGSNNTVRGGKVARNVYGITSSGDCNFYINNNITNNSDGIYLSGFNNSIIRNNITNNKYRGIYLLGSDNAIYQNEIMNNNLGIVIDFYGNRIYHNNFIGNSRQASLNLPRAVGIWDDGYPSGGNYWSNYTGIDLNHDGIGDSPHMIDTNNQDNHPLMGKFHSCHITHIEQAFTLTLISNSTITFFDVGFLIENPEIRTILIFASGETGYGFCRLSIPKGLMAPPYTIIIDNGETAVLHYNETLFDNGTHRWIYFAYEPSTHEIEIVAEFPSFLIMPLFMGFSVIAIVFAKKKLPKKTQT